MVLDDVERGQAGRLVGIPWPVVLEKSARVARFVEEQILQAVTCW